MANKVLYIGGFELPDRNAAAQRVLAIAKTMRMAGYKTDFIGVTTFPDDVNIIREIEGFKYTSISYPNGLGSWVYHLTKFLPLKMIVEANPEIVVLYNFPAIAQHKIIKYCHSKGIKVLGDLTEWYQPTGNNPHNLLKRLDVKLRMEKYNYELDGIIAISAFLTNYYKDKVPTLFIPATVDLSAPKWNRDAQPTFTKPVKLVYAGCAKTKTKDRVDLIIKSVSRFDGFELIIMGLTHDDYIKVYQDKTDYGSRVHFMGKIPHEDVLKVLQKSDFELIIRDDNLVTRAGFPTKFVESLSCGVPVIATPTSNICDYLKDGINGFMVTENHSLDDILRVLSVMNDKEILTIKENAKKITDFDYHNYVNAFKDFVANI